MPKPEEVTGITVEDFASDPIATVKKLKAEIRAEVRREIIGANLLFLALGYLLLKGSD